MSSLLLLKLAEFTIIIISIAAKEYTFVPKGLLTLVSLFYCSYLPCYCYYHLILYIHYLLQVSSVLDHTSISKIPLFKVPVPSAKSYKKIFLNSLHFPFALPKSIGAAYT